MAIVAGVIAGVAYGTWIIAGATVAVFTASIVATVWATKKSQKMTERSLSESEKQRKLSEDALKFQEAAQTTSKSQFSVNVVLGIFGIIISIITLWVMFRKPRGATSC